MKKIVIKVGMPCNKCRTKAMKVVAAIEGVKSVGLDGEDKLVVTGVGVDSVNLTRKLRKKLGYADIEAVEEKKEEKKDEKKKEQVIAYPYAYAYPYPCAPPVPYADYDSSPSICSIQ